MTGPDLGGRVPAYCLPRQPDPDQGVWLGRSLMQLSAADFIEPAQVRGGGPEESKVPSGWAGGLGGVGEWLTQISGKKGGKQD